MRTEGFSNVLSCPTTSDETSSLWAVGVLITRWVLPQRWRMAGLRLCSYANCFLFFDIICVAVQNKIPATFLSPTHLELIVLFS